MAGAGQPDEQHLQVRHARDKGVSVHGGGRGRRADGGEEYLALSPEYLRRRADGAVRPGDSSRSTEGSGLGLSIATSLTAIQGGDFRLTIDGDLFKVTLTLPRAEQEEKQE